MGGGWLRRAREADGGLLAAHGDRGRDGETGGEGAGRGGAGIGNIRCGGAYAGAVGIRGTDLER